MVWHITVHIYPKSLIPISFPSNAMLLQLAPASTFSDSTNNGTYSTETGQVVYSVISPWSLGSPQTVVYRTVADLPDPLPDALFNQDGRVLSSGSTRRSGFFKFAEIDFHSWSPTIIRYNGKSYSERELFEEGGFFESSR